MFESPILLQLPMFECPSFNFVRMFESSTIIVAWSLSSDHTQYVQVFNVNATLEKFDGCKRPTQT